MPGAFSRRSIAHLGVSQRVPLRKSFRPSRRQRRQTGPVYRAMLEVRGQRSGVRYIEFEDRAGAKLVLNSDLRPLIFLYYTRRFLRGRQPLCGSGVISSIDFTFRPAASSDVIALSRPLPGPLTFTSTSLTPYFFALSA